MSEILSYQLLADMVLTLHFAVVVFIVGGLILIVVGNLWAWHWVNALWLRLAHLAAILTVVAEAWLGIPCPLTLLDHGCERKRTRQLTAAVLLSIGCNVFYITMRHRGCSRWFTHFLGCWWWQAGLFSHSPGNAATINWTFNSLRCINWEAFGSDREIC